eukprot:10909107-Lingulodinium_polyedra.AAC.1
MHARSCVCPTTQGRRAPVVGPVPPGPGCACSGFCGPPPRLAEVLPGPAFVAPGVLLPQLTEQ